jgi:hypothetical protein
MHFVDKLQVLLCGVVQVLLLGRCLDVGHHSRKIDPMLCVLEQDDDDDSMFVVHCVFAGDERPSPTLLLLLLL